MPILKISNTLMFMGYPGEVESSLRVFCDGRIIGHGVAKSLVALIL
jgi:hypothetical protein